MNILYTWDCLQSIFVLSGLLQKTPHCTSAIRYKEQIMSLRCLVPLFIVIVYDEPLGLTMTSYKSQSIERKNALNFLAKHPISPANYTIQAVSITTDNGAGLITLPK